MQNPGGRALKIDRVDDPKDGLQVTITFTPEDLAKVNDALNDADKAKVWCISQSQLISEQIRCLMIMARALEKSAALASVGKIPLHESLGAEPNE